MIETQRRMTMDAGSMQPKTYASGAAQPAQPPLGSLYEALKYLQSATDDIHQTTDRLCGSQPEEIVGADGKLGNVSLFSQIEDVAGRIREAANRLAGDNQRILNRL
jgi:hypothetical protein